MDGHFGGLFSYGVRDINRVNPLFFQAENVSGLSSANEGKAFETILVSLNNAGQFGYNTPSTSTSLKITEFLRRDTVIFLSV